MLLIADRFEVRSELARGATTATYRAHDHELGLDVALKEVEITDPEGWDPAAFERATAGLLALEHPGIPRYLAAEMVTDDGLRLFVAQQFEDGPTLEGLSNDGKEWTDEEAIADAIGIAEVLKYAHELTPPVVHGRIAASHLVRCADGHIALINFRFATDDEVVTPASDLRALGDTLRQLVDAGGALAHILERLTTEGECYESTADLLRDLQSVTEATQKAAPISPDIAATAPLTAPSDTTAPVAAAKPPLAATAPLEAPKPVMVVPAPAPVAPPAPVVTLSSPAVTDEVLYYRRTKDFPRWTTVEPLEHGEFFIAAELRDVEERRLELEIIDSLNRLEVRGWVNRKKRSDARKKSVVGIIVAGTVVSILALLLYAPVFPLAVVGTLGGLAVFMLKSGKLDESPDVELTIVPEELSLSREGEFRLRSEPRAASWSVVEHTELFMTTDRQVPVLLLSHEMRMQAAWLHRYLEARCQEIGSRLRFSPGQPAMAAPRAVAPVLQDHPTEEVPIATAADTAEVSPLKRPDFQPPAEAPPGSLSEVRDEPTQPVVLSHFKLAPAAAPAGEVKDVETQQVQLAELSGPEIEAPAEETEQDLSAPKSEVEDIETQQVQLSHLTDMKSEVEDQATEQVSLATLAKLGAPAGESDT